MIGHVSDDPAYRRLAEQTVRDALPAVGIELESVEFGEHDPDAPGSWLFFVVDPESEDHATATSASTAAAHLTSDDPNGILGQKGSRLAVTIHGIGLATEASLTLRDEDGKPRIAASPWQEGLSMARVSFTYRPA